MIVLYQTTCVYVVCYISELSLTESVMSFIPLAQDFYLKNVVMCSVNIL